MIPYTPPETVATLRIPRESGDDPAPQGFVPGDLSYSPRERG